MAFSTHDRIDSKMSMDFNDVMLQPDAQQIAPDQADLATHISTSIGLKVPFASLPSITDTAMAIQMAQKGGIGIIPNTMSLSAQADMVRQVKRSQSRIVTDMVMVTPETSIIEALEYKQRYNISLMPVVEGGTQFLAGFIELQDDMDAYNPEHTVSHYMSDQPYATVMQSHDVLEDAYRTMDSQNVPYVAVTDHQNRFIALVRKSDKDKATAFPNATIDAKGSLRVIAMVGTHSKEYDRVNALMDAGVDAILVYANHGHSKEMLDMITHIRRQRSANVDVIAGNIMTEQSAMAVIDAGANGIFISINKEYADLGIGMPTLTSIMHVAEGASLHNVPVIVGCMDMPQLPIAHQIKSFAAGAACLMIEDTAVIEHTLPALRQAIAYTGCVNIREFAVRSRFVHVSCPT